jgi:hypothetical protein
MVCALGRRAVIRNLAVGSACSILPAKSTLAACPLMFGSLATPPDRWFRIANFPEVDQERTYYRISLEPADGDITNNLIWRSVQQSGDVLLMLTLLSLDVAKGPFEHNCWPGFRCGEYAPGCWCREWRLRPTFRAAISNACLMEDLDIRFAFTDSNKNTLLPPWTIRVYTSNINCPGVSGDFPWVAGGPLGFDYVKNDGTLESKPWSGLGITTPSHIRINADGRAWQRCL